MKQPNLKRRDFIKAVGVGATAVALPGFFNCGKNSRLPNVLFLAVDDLRPQINCYGHKQMISPNIDQLAARGVLFKRTFCQVPVCGASRSSLLTGVRPTRNRFVTFHAWADKDCPGVPQLPKHFRDNGYYTISNGKVYHHLEDSAGGWSEPAWHPDGEWRDYVRPENIEIARQSEAYAGPAFEAADEPDNAYFDGKIADKAIADLNRLQQMNQPFFLAAGFKKPHLPFNAPQKYWDWYPRESINLADNPFRPKGAPDVALHNWGELRAYFGIPKQGPLPDEMARTLIHGYYACVSYTDAQIGRVINELERLGLRENTIIVLWGDHGWQLGEHGLWCKHCNFETSLHSPLIVSAPGLKENIQTSALTEFVDIYPSLCELAGLPLPHHLEGTSFVPLMKNPDRPWKTAALSRYRDGDSIRTDRHRYTEYTNDQGEVIGRMLYDHQVDSMENVNIADLPENQELVGNLSKMLREGYQAVLPH